MRFGKGSSRKRVLTSAGATVLLAAGAVMGVTATAADAAAGCAVTYTSHTWGTSSGGFAAYIDITNTGDPLSGWALTFTFPGTQQITSSFSAQWSQDGRLVTARNPSWGGSIPSGRTFGIGFNGSWTGGNPPPTDFALNGVPCTVKLVPSPTPSPTPTPPSPERLRILVSPSRLTVPEGGTASVQVRLSRRPPGNVVVGTARVSGDTDLSAGPPLTFTPDDWDVPQPLTVTAAEDDDAVDGQATFDTRSSQITGSSAVLWNAVEQDDDR
ncbi:cellulose binding domain-containing protein [Streptosporangium sp. NPDC023615]|uniref:cellulose binding domain-containing protein n=1 Tax=Streptosporangium sp. NPDC023615 TaxID=3154794 RepID=UPI0034169CC6